MHRPSDQADQAGSASGHDPGIYQERDDLTGVAQYGMEPRAWVLPNTSAATVPVWVCGQTPGATAASLPRVPNRALALATPGFSG